LVVEYYLEVGWEYLGLGVVAEFFEFDCELGGLGFV